MKRTFKLLALAALSVLAFAAVAYASGDAAAEHHGLNWENFFFRVANFVIFAAIIWKLAGSKISGTLKSRKEGISAELDDLAAKKAEAEEKLKHVEQGIANLEQEKKAILEQAKAQGETLKAAIIAKAEKDAAAMKEQARLTAENEAKTALDGIRAEMADMVVEAATKIVQERLTDQDHDKLVDEYLTKVVLN